MMGQTDNKEEEEEAQKVYREILEVVGSTPCGRGRMVGYGEEAQTTLRRGDRSNAARLGTRHHNRSVCWENISELENILVLENISELENILMI